MSNKPMEEISWNKIILNPNKSRRRIEREQRVNKTKRK